MQVCFLKILFRSHSFNLALDKLPANHQLAIFNELTSIDGKGEIALFGSKKYRFRWLLNSKGEYKKFTDQRYCIEFSIDDYAILALSRKVPVSGKIISEVEPICIVKNKLNKFSYGKL